MKIAYWICSLLLCGFLLASAVSYLFHSNTINGIRKLGLPDYLRFQFAVLKLIAAVVILSPSMSLVTKEWAYAGVFFFILTAIVAHAVHRDPWYLNAVNVVLIALLFGSRYLLLQ